MVSVGLLLPGVDGFSGLPGFSGFSGSSPSPSSSSAISASSSSSSPSSTSSWPLHTSSGSTSVSKYSVTEGHLPVLASMPVFLQTVFFSTESGISNSSGDKSSCTRSMIPFHNRKRKLVSVLHSLLSSYPPHTAQV